MKEGEGEDLISSMNEERKERSSKSFPYVPIYVPKHLSYLGGAFFARHSMLDIRICKMELMS